MAKKKKRSKKRTKKKTKANKSFDKLSKRFKKSIKGVSQLDLKKTFKKKKKSAKRKSKKTKSKKGGLTTKQLWLKRIIYFSVLGSVAAWLFWGLPLPTQIASRQVPVSTKIYDRNGELLYEIYADQRSDPVNLESIPDHVRLATLAIEDKDFYNHYGVSFVGITRAAYNIAFKKKLQGGSTLTQQLVKNALLTPERTLKRKVRELALTLFVETIYTKDKILELYLNQIPYGGTAYGIGAAADTYFGKSVEELTLAESALLAGLPAAPSRFSPFGAQPELAKGRQEAVLNNMLTEGFISSQQAEEARNQELTYIKREEFEAPHFSLWVKQLLSERYGEQVVEKGGLRVTTTLDLELQDFAQTAVATEVAKLMDRRVGNGAALVTRPQTGEILAMVGSKDYFAQDEDGNVNITLALRQPGSSIKPINYALGLKDRKITPSTVLADVPTCFIVQGQAPYCPKNYSGNFHGGVQVRYALGNSYNIPAVRVLALNGIENFITFAGQMGITTFTDPANYGLSLTLGGGEVRMIDMATAFGVFSNEGVKVPLTPILKVEDWQGNILEEFDPERTGNVRVISPAVAFLISHILHDNNARIAAFGPRSELVVEDHPEVSVKTGTTNDLKDNWTIGFTPHALVVTWVGNNDSTPMSGAVSGVSGASPIWNTVMKEVLDKTESGNYSEQEDDHAWPRRPDSIAGRSVCSDTGIVPGEETACSTRYEYFLEDNIPFEFEGGIQEVEFHTDTGEFITPETPQEKRRKESHFVMYDPLGTFLCLDCAITYASHSAQIKYPLSLNE